MYRAVSRNPNPTTVAATRRIFGRDTATIVELGFRDLHCTFFIVMVRVRVGGCNSPHSACMSCIEAITAHIKDVTAHMEDVTSHVTAAQNA